jgi:hypothetical protein
MTKTDAWRRSAVGAVALCGALLVPGSAAALSTHSATDTTQNSDGDLVATAKCAHDEHVVSGGFAGATDGGAISSRAVHGDSWRVVFYPGVTNTLTTQAYCAKHGHLSTHTDRVAGVETPPNTTATARCAAGETLVSGGLEFIADNLSSESGSAVFKAFAASSRAWQVTVAFEAVPADIKAYAYCGRGVDVKVRSGQSHSIPNDGVGTAKASCHRGETLLSGGYTTTPAPDWENTSGPDLFYYASHRLRKRTWTASAHNYSNADGTIKAFAYCTG